MNELVRRLGLKPHPEGGFYRETYRAKHNLPIAALPPRFSGRRSVSTAIYFLLPEGTHSRLHRILSDELWHFYEGGPLIIGEIRPTGELQKTTLGPPSTPGCTPQHCVPAGCWFSATPQNGAEFSLVGCTVAPGFDFLDLEMAQRKELLDEFPQHKDFILQSTDP